MALSTKQKIHKSARKLVRKFRKSRESTRQPGQPRMLKKQQYKSFRLHRKIRPYQPPLPKARKLFRQSLALLRSRWRVFAGIAVIYLVLLMILVKGFTSTLDIQGTKSVLDQFYLGFSGKALTAAALFGSLASSSGSGPSPTASVYQTFIIVMTILATVWVVRQQRSQEKIRVRDAYYQGMYPLVPFILITVVMGFQLIPLGIGGWLYTATINGGIAVTAIEKVLWILMIILLSLLSLYMLISSLFALYIVTLPNMTPMRALRSARQLTLHRRWTIIRKIMYLTFMLVLLAALTMLPFILWLPQIAEWVFFSISSLGLLIPVAYLYTLYRELLNE